ncbi:transcription factor DYT1-like [Lotus japonicus]|uniref:transcription factor DYT1-like n=1 Tax=Lotus japonicus TaxID=34305 RepID=UPI002589B2C2|nr:transcription factor DYT1-like [Lotus japonicus]
MGHVYQDRLSISMEELCSENGSSRGRMGRKSYDDDTRTFKSKNLETERKRREKLSSRLLMLRSLVPIITNMNKETIIDDSITYIKKLQDEVESLTRELPGIEANSKEVAKPKVDQFDAAEEMKKWGIQEEVQVTKIDGNKLWVKMIIENKRGGFKNLVQSLDTYGIELIDTNVTAMKGALLITTCIQGMHGETLEVNQTEQFLLGILRTI